MIKYFLAPDIEEKARHIVQQTGMGRDFSRIHFIRSKDSQSRRIIARCHGMPKVLQLAMQLKAHYVIEIISERFDRMNEKEQAKVIIHELLHIPAGMKGGFRQHDYVCDRNVEEIYRNYVKQ
ncbi:MAG: putative metallopeptidase [Candidatus Aenigmarchaeota archaeon]|nr:putative metallopeptidase [Candidatus Aenigmarchaeota archaeon]